MSACLHSIANQNKRALVTRNGALNQEQTLLGINSMHGEILSRLTIATHTACHLDAAENATRSGAATDRTWRTVLALNTVRCAQTMEAVTLHNTGKTVTTRGSSYVDERACYW